MQIKFTVANNLVPPRDHALGKSRISADDCLSGFFCKVPLQSMVVIFMYLSVMLVFPQLAPHVCVEDRKKFSSLLLFIFI